MMVLFPVMISAESWGRGVFAGHLAVYHQKPPSAARGMLRQRGYALQRLPDGNGGVELELLPRVQGSARYAKLLDYALNTQRGDRHRRNQRFAGVARQRAAFVLHGGDVCGDERFVERVGATAKLLPGSERVVIGYHANLLKNVSAVAPTLVIIEKRRA